MSRFEKKRMSLLLGDKCSAASTDVDEGPKKPLFLTQTKAQRTKPPKSHLFSDYHYIYMKARRGNSIERVAFPCFKDGVLFKEALPLRAM